MENKSLKCLLIFNLLLFLLGCGEDNRLKVSDSNGIEIGFLVSATNNVYSVLTSGGFTINYYAATGEIAACPPVSYSDTFCTEGAHVKIEDDSFLMPETMVCKNRNKILMRPESTVIHDEKSSSYIGVSINGDQKCSLYSKVDTYKAQRYVEVKNLSKELLVTGPLTIYY